MIKYQVLNAERMKTYSSRHMAGHARLGQICPTPGGSADPSTFGPEVACQRTSAGDIICSNNVIYSAGCPVAANININVDGIAAESNGVPIAPAPLSVSNGGVPTVPSSAPASFPILPVAGVAAAGILAIILLS